jgi:uncharacterized glyoxalase superfamily protein PhnB
MSNFPKFSMAFNIGKTNEERIEAFTMYKNAFNAKKISEGTPPDGDDIHITIEINGLNILLAPGGKVEKTVENAMCCEFLFDNEDNLRKAYDILTQNCLYNSIGSYPWAPVGALVTDKFGICWWLRT